MVPWYLPFSVESRCSPEHPSQRSAESACLTLFYSIVFVVSLSAHLSWFYNQQLSPSTHYYSFVSSREIHLSFFFPFQIGCLFLHLHFLSHITYIIDCDHYCEPNLYSLLYFPGLSTIISKSHFSHKNERFFNALFDL